MGLLTKVNETIGDERLLQRGDTIVVAVSGGPDSIAMLHILNRLSGRWDWKLIAAHVNHRFRGRESDEEADFVVNFARTLEIPVEVGNIDVPQYIEETAMNAQTAAREQRYRFLRETAEQYKANCIAVAHHADDQAETVLMRLIRGTGPGGLSGMPIMRTEGKVKLVRPLLRIYKSEVLDYCREENLSYREDSSNLLRKYFRNQVRLDVLPMLSRYNDQFAESLVRLAGMMDSENAYMESVVRRIFEEGVSREGEEYSFSRRWFAGTAVALQRRLIKLILYYLSRDADFLDYRKTEGIRTAVMQERLPNLTMNLSDEVHFTKEYDRIRFHKFKLPAQDYHYAIKAAIGELEIKEAGFRLIFLKEEVVPGSTPFVVRECSKEDSVFDYDLLDFPLHIRNRRAGDRMQVIGLNGSKKVKDILIDDKIPPADRERVPLLADASGHILWIPGIRRSRHAAVSAITTRILRIKAVDLKERR